MVDQEGGGGSGGFDQRVSVRHLLTLFVWAVALALIFHFFKPFRLLLLGVLAAGCLAATLYPLMRYVPFPRALSAVIVGVAPILVSVGLLVGLSWLLAAPIKQEIERWPQVREKVNGALAGWSEMLGLDEPLTIQTLLEGAGTLFADGGGTEVISTTAGALSGVAVSLVLLFFGSIFLMAEPPGRLLTPLVDALPPRRARQVRAAFDDLVPRLRWWVIGTLFSMSVVGLATWASFALIGLDFAAPLALLAGLAEIVPTIGPAAAFLVALLFASTQGAGTVLGVIVTYLVIQLVESYILVPLVMKKAVKMPPVVTLFTVVLWGKVFGAAGLFLAIPINLVLWSFYDHLVLRPRKHERAPSSAQLSRDQAT
ncbi:MAG TPA: AI-2E family transporter [Tepidisphaeraceae bacterium]|nr:AI-2E family transporter [Tepidisphaeraceae bacterium]